MLMSLRRPIKKKLDSQLEFLSINIEKNLLQILRIFIRYFYNVANSELSIIFIYFIEFSQILETEGYFKILDIEIPIPRLSLALC